MIWDVSQYELSQLRKLMNIQMEIWENYKLKIIQIHFTLSGGRAYIAYFSAMNLFVKIP